MRIRRSRTVGSPSPPTPSHPVQRPVSTSLRNQRHQQRRPAQTRPAQAQTSPGPVDEPRAQRAGAPFGAGELQRFETRRRKHAQARATKAVVSDHSIHASSRRSGLSGKASSVHARGGLLRLWPARWTLAHVLRGDAVEISERIETAIRGADVHVVHVQRQAAARAS